MPRQWYTPGEVATCLGVSSWAVSRLLRSGKLRSVVTGKHVRHVKAEDLEAYARACAPASDVPDDGHRSEDRS